MGLKNCPSCNLMLFDTDTECIYCGWKQSDQTDEMPDKAVTAETIATDATASTETEAASLEQATNEQSDFEEDAIDAKKQAANELKSIKNDFHSVVKAAQQHTIEAVDIEDTIEENIVDIEDTIEEKIIDIEDTIEETQSFFTEHDYNNGIRYLGGKRFNLFDIIAKHGAVDKISIIREIRETTETSLKDAVKLLDNSLDAFFEFQRNNLQEDDILNYVPDHKPIHNNDTDIGTVGQVKNNIHRALAYNLIVRRGPDRKIQIIDELMHSEHISLESATEIVEDAIKEYRQNKASQ